MTILKGLPIGYNRDLQEDKRIVFRAYDTVSSCLTMAAAIVNSASFIKENIAPTLERGFLDATSLAEYLVTKGVPFRTAHHIVGGLVLKCEKEGKHALAQLSLADFQQAAGEHGGKIGQDVYEPLGAHKVVQRNQTPGAAGGKRSKEEMRGGKRDVAGLLGGHRLFLLPLEVVDAPLDVAAALDVEPVPTRLQQVVDLRGGFGDADETLRVGGGDGAGDDGFSGPRAAGQDDP